MIVSEYQLWLALQYRTMPWTPDSSVASLVARMVGRRKDTLSEQTRDAKKAIRAELSAREVLRSGQYVARIRDAYTDAVREYAQGLTRDVLEVISEADGSLEPYAT